MCGDTQSKFPVKDTSHTGFGLYRKDPVKRLDCLKYPAVLKYSNTYFYKTDLVSSATMSRSKHPHQHHISMGIKVWSCCLNLYFPFPLTRVQIKIRMHIVKLPANQFRKRQVSVNPEIFVTSKFQSY